MRRIPLESGNDSYYTTTSFKRLAFEDVFSLPRDELMTAVHLAIGAPKDDDAEPEYAGRIFTQLQKFMLIPYSPQPDTRIKRLVTSVRDEMVFHFFRGDGL